MTQETVRELRRDATETRRELQRLLAAVQTLRPSDELSSELQGVLSALVRKIEYHEGSLSAVWDSTNDADTGITAAQEQEQTHLQNVAKLIGTYYNTLVEEGLPDGLIFNLISDYQHFSFSRWMDEQEG